MIKLSIIIPAYNAEPYIHELLDRLEPQITDEIQVIVIDDCSNPKLEIDKPWVELYRNKTNREVSYSRNRGLELAKGEVVHFIDADDLVAKNYVEYMLNIIDTKDFDYIDLSWKTLPGGIQFDYKLDSDSQALGNASASVRAFKRSFIGDNRFPEKKDAAEDEHFTRHLQLKKAKHVCATEYMYFYRTAVEGSKSKKFLACETNTKRIVYTYSHVTKDMTWLLDEIKKEDDVNEVFLMTWQNDIPELEIYCQMRTPADHIRAYEKRGERNDNVTILKHPIETQVVIYTSQTFEVGGIETFIYNFCYQMRDYYDILVLYDSITTKQLARLSKMVRCVRNDTNLKILCDTIIVNRISDNIPKNVSFKQSVQMVHCVQQQGWHIPKGRTHMVNVSEASKKSFGEEAENGIVIHNLTVPEDVQKALVLVSAVRVGAADKQGNDERCVNFAMMLKRAGIPFVWLYFSDRPMPNAPEGMIHCGCTLNIKPYLKMADYYVGLSGAEAFSYSLLEALEQQVPLLVTPLEQNKEMGIEDGKNAYIVPFDVESFEIEKILNIPKFEYHYENAEIIKQWRNLLGNTKPKKDYKPIEEMLVEVIMDYYDIKMGKENYTGDRLLMPTERAMELREKGFIKIIEG